MLLKVPGVLSATFAADGRLAITCRDNSVRVFNAGGSPVITIRDMPDTPTAAVFVKSGPQLITGDYRGVLSVWDTDEKAKKATAAGTLSASPAADQK
jgi:WD40 repeat protein